jgi:SAM-dependent methyltransferase
MKRKPFQGLVSVLRFNWHFFVLAIVGMLALPFGCWSVAPAYLTFSLATSAAGFLTILISMLATLHAYDFSGLYVLRWLDPCMTGARTGANIHSGFDETTELLREVYSGVDWLVFDFYDPAKHTEISIKRARAAHPPQPGTLKTTTSHLPLCDQALDRIVLILAAHEIRDHDERVTFFRELRRVLADDGLVIVTEHLRDFFNIIAYTMGAWHFHPRNEWLATFEEAGFELLKETKNNLLISTFILRKHGTVY